MSQQEIDADIARHAERHLWAAVIHRAWADYFEDARDAKPADRRLVRIEARLFLLSQRGNWAASRELVCLSAGIDADALRERAAAWDRWRWCRWLLPLAANG